MVRGFHGLANIGAQHFFDIFNELERANIQVKSLRWFLYFPRVLEAQDYGFLYKGVTKEELLVVLNTFQQDKSLSLNGWIVEFLLDFLELLGDDLLRVIKEFNVFGRVIGNFNSTFISLIPKIDFPKNFVGFMPISLLITCAK